MNPQDLRIGNLLDFHGQNVIVLGIKKTQIECGYFNDSIGFNRPFDQTAPKPIPLTEEWLIKLGFQIHEKHENGTIFRKEISYRSGFKVWLDIINKGGKGEPILLFILSDNAGTDFMLPYHYIFVHELQNLWTSLGGKELTAQQ